MWLEFSFQIIRCRSGRGHFVWFCSETQRRGSLRVRVWPESTPSGRRNPHILAFAGRCYKVTSPYYASVWTHPCVRHPWPLALNQRRPGICQLLYGSLLQLIHTLVIYSSKSDGSWALLTAWTSFSQSTTAILELSPVLPCQPTVSLPQEATRTDFSLPSTWPQVHSLHAAEISWNFYRWPPLCFLSISFYFIIFLTTEYSV